MTIMVSVPTSEIDETSNAEDENDSIKNLTNTIINTPRMLRIRSAENVSIVEKCNSNNNLNRLSRSLKLLGLNPEEFGIEAKQQSSARISRPCSAMSIKKAMERIGPTFKTRLQSRSMQLEDLRCPSAASNETPRLQEQISRQQLSQAVYEEWYFQKVKENMKKIRKEHVENEEMLKEKMKKEKETSEKSAQSFQTWDEIKKQKLRKQKQIEKRKKQRESEELRSKEEKMHKAYLAWKEDKDKILKEKIIKKKREQEEKLEKEENEKKEKLINAGKVYVSWKESADKKIQISKLEEMREKKLKDEDTKRRKEEKMKDNLSAFLAWKAKKEKEIKNKRSMKPSKTNLRRAISESRLEESQIAFEDWLVESLQRSNTNIVIKHDVPWKPL